MTPSTPRPRLPYHQGISIGRINGRHVARRSPRASTEITAADRKARAVELRARGHTFQEIADTLGYASPAGASKAYHAALRERPAQNVDQLRAEAASRYEHLLAEAMRQIDAPGPRVSAIGKVAVFPPDHPRAGEIVEDESIRNRGIEAARKLINDHLALNGVTTGHPPAPNITVDQRSTTLIIAEINHDRALRGHPPLRVIPGVTA